MVSDPYEELEEYKKLNPWTAEDIAFWTGTPTYQPWKDVAAFFRDTNQGDDDAA
jgi:hypothetical protein